ncbi:cytochrome b5-like [Plodia interpunctella]|uniref:cytochrome b5-like n=1 Tax=Plodia interpunctella TaxID=58824 RepID=UPI0023676AFF|nr:cytochrome b5-like [Plodia interpunctella]
MTLTQFTRDQVATHNRLEDAMIIIDNLVYNVTTFLEDHPGGPEVLLNNAGKDASQCFSDVGHSDDAKAWRQEFLVGEVVAAERREVKTPAPSWVGAEDTVTLASVVHVWGPPIVMAIASTLLYFYLFS